jgi:hypothetical protein
MLIEERFPDNVSALVKLGGSENVALDVLRVRSIF